MGQAATNQPNLDAPAQAKRAGDDVAAQEAAVALNQSAGDDTPPEKLVLTDKAKWPLVGLGLLLVTLFLLGVGFSRIWGGETEQTAPPSASPADQSGATVASQVVTTKTKTKNAPSDTLLTAVLASGAALLIAGFLYSRISTIKIAGVAEIGLTTKEMKTVDDKVKDKLGKTDARVDDTKKLVFDELREVKKRVGLIQLPDNDIKRIAERISEGVVSPSEEQT